MWPSLSRHGLVRGSGPLRTQHRSMLLFTSTPAELLE